MGLMDIASVKNKSKIINALKDGVNFGIHGISKNDFFSWNKCPSDFLAGHYFVVGENERNLSDDNFYSGLCSSVNMAMGHSCRLHDKDIYFLLGIEKENFYICASDPHTDGRIDTYGKTFPIGHNFSYPVEIKSVGILEKEVRFIHDKADDFVYSIDNIINEHIVKALFVQRELVKKAVGKIYSEIVKF